MKKEIISGIYRITNLTNGKIYIGSSIDIYKRWKQHISKLNNNNHHNIHLQRSWNIHKEESFIFDILEISNDLINQEQYWIDSTDCCDINIGYNISRTAIAPKIKDENDCTYLNKVNHRLFVAKHGIKNLEIMFTFIIPYSIFKDDNIFYVKNKFPTKLELCEYLEIGKSSLATIIKSLQDKGMIKVFAIKQIKKKIKINKTKHKPKIKSKRKSMIKKNKKPIKQSANRKENKNIIKNIKYATRYKIYINPYLYMATRNIKEEVFEMFKSEEYIRDVSAIEEYPYGYIWRSKPNVKIL